MHLGESLPTEHPTCAKSRRTTGCRSTLPSDWTAFQDMYTGRCKFTGFTDPTANRQLERQITTHRTSPEGAPRVTADKTPKTDFVVTPDPRRAPFTPEEFMQAHLDRASPAGPRGNGFTPENVAGKTGYYTFEIAPGDVGTRRNHAADDTFFLVFSHHTPDSMNNLLLELGNPEIRHAGWDVENLLTRFPNVLAWVNGHTHTNTITLKAGAVPERRHWEITTTSHVDCPQHARVIEVVDNADESNVGADADHNTELLLVNPLS